MEGLVVEPAGEEAPQLRRVLIVDGGACLALEEVGLLDALGGLHLWLDVRDVGDQDEEQRRARIRHKPVKEAGAEGTSAKVY